MNDGMGGMCRNGRGGDVGITNKRSGDTYISLKLGGFFFGC